MGTIEKLFLDTGLSWTMSKILPYVFSILLGLFFCLLLRKRISKRKKIWRFFANLVLLFLPFVIYFSLSPIYSGDFSNNFSSIKRSKETREVNENSLYVISIPGCPYCFESIEQLKLLKERNPSLKITFKVCTKDQEHLNWYKNEAGDAINVVSSHSPKDMVKLAKGRFPTFVLSKKGSDLKTWNNNSFGVRAMDYIEESLQ